MVVAPDMRDDCGADCKAIDWGTVLCKSLVGCEITEFIVSISLELLVLNRLE